MAKVFPPRPLLAAALALAFALPARSVPIPAPPADRAHRFGVYAWGFDASAYPAGPVSPDRLNWAADKVARTGSRTIRVYLGARDDYGVNPKNLPEDEYFLSRLVAGPGYPGTSAGSAYDTLFRDSRFATYLLTVYSPGDNRNDWSDGYTPFEALFERRQIGRLGDLLLSAYPGKRFIFLNWEGDNALASFTDQPVAWDGFAAWTAARAAGVRDAQGRNPGGAERLFSGLELNRLRDNGGVGGAWCDRCVLAAIAPGADVDYYSYSSWETLIAKQRDPGVSLAEVLRMDLGHILEVLQKNRPAMTPSRLLLGEAGFARTAPRDGECRAAAALEELVQAVQGTPEEPGLGVSYVLLWQVLDNLQTAKVEWESFGLYRGSDGGLTLPGATFRSLLAGAGVALPAGCPRLPDCPGDPQNSCAVVDPEAPWKLAPILRPGGPLALVGADFSAMGNTVHITQGTRSFTLAGGQPGWRESPERIDLILPKELLPGQFLLWVTDARGLDSNGQLLSIAPRPYRKGRGDGGPLPD